ncbi:MAG TPA: thiamine pyrophosphate-dependent enzyme, partial [Clostridia bacterium]|nr:thiamine pyrophosphate-dependent enzyme [Clostridia bacterium]
FPADHNLFVGMIGMHGTYAAGKAASESDLIIALGARFSDRVAGNRKLFAPKAQILHIDIDATEIDKIIKSTRYIVADLRETLHAINERLPECNHKQWENQIKQWKEHVPSYAEDDLTTLNPKFILDTLKSHASPDTIIVTDVGQHQMWTAQYYPFTRPRTFLTSGGLGTMGYGMGAAVGAKAANPHKKVVLITGDGSFHMNCMEMLTAANNNLPITIILMNNQVLGMVRQWQKLFYSCRFSQTSPGRCTDFPALARSLGAEGVTVDNRSDYEKALEAALDSQNVSLIECMISPDANVLPMIPPGNAVDEIITNM